MKRSEIRAHGGDVVVHIEIDGVGRRVRVTREAIEDRLKMGPGEAASMSDDARCDLVGSLLPEVIATAKRKISAGDDQAEVVVLRSGEL